MRELQSLSVQPIAAVVETDLAMLAGDEEARIGQGPVEILGTAKIEAAPVGPVDNGPAVRKPVEILDSERQHEAITTFISPIFAVQSFIKSELVIQ